ncbi:MAG: dihydropteroate synthase, partial [Sphingobacteriaceae bacterium]
MAKDTFFQKKVTLNAGGKLIDLSRPKVMGIINITPDSFFAGSRKMNTADAVFMAEKMLNEGVTFLDLGAYSSRPGATDISPEEETDRLLSMIEVIAKSFPEAVLSVDTFRASVAEAGIRAGAHLINDISGGDLDEAMFSTVARLQVPYILMHTKGTPQNMTEKAQYQDVFTEVFDDLAAKVCRLKQLNVHDVIIDPGFGFAKTKEQSFELLRKMAGFELLNLPILAGVSRKGMIHKTLNTSAEKALNGTTVLNTLALQNGANILRVHDVKEAV